MLNVKDVVGFIVQYVNLRYPHNLECHQDMKKKRNTGKNNWMRVEIR
jgi:hypothetical protein